MVFPFDSEIILQDTRALLRPIRSDDLNILSDPAFSDPDLLRFSPRPVYNIHLLKQYIENALQLREQKKRYTFTVIDKVRNICAGSTSFLNISDEHDRLEIGATWYGKDFQRTGLNRHCKYLLLEYAFDILGAHRVEFVTDERNTSSRRAIEQIGGQYEGILRQHLLLYDGFRRNTVCYSILRSEWPKVKEHFPIQRI